MSPEKHIRLADEYNDLLAEFCSTDNHDERCRCAERMADIIDLLAGYRDDYSADTK